MINYKKQTETEMYIRYMNMWRRCYDEKWQEENNKAYRGHTICKEWLENRNECFYPWLLENYYEVDNDIMELDHNIIDYYNTVYSPDKCLIVPKTINGLFSHLELGKTNIKYNPKTGKHIVKVSDNGTDIITECDSYPEALDCFCNTKQGIIQTYAEDYKDQLPDKVYQAIINTDVKELNKSRYDNYKE